MSGFGGTIKLQGEAAYRQALQAISADLKNVAAQQKLTAASYDKADSSLTALSKRSDELKNKLASQQEKVKTLTAALKDYQEQQAKNKTAIQEYQAQLDKEKNKLAEIETQYGKTSKEYEQQAKVVAELEKELKKANTQYEKNETTVKKTQAALTSAEADVKKTGTAMEKLGQQAEEAGVGANKLGLEVEDSGKKVKKAGEDGYTVFKNVLANLATQVINKAIDGVKRLGNAVFDAGVNFDSAMAKVQAVSGASASDMEKLTAKAKEMGETTKFSASESAEALNYMAMAGWKTEDMLGGLEGIMNLAAASGADLATTSDIVTDALTAMGYSASDAGRLADVMAAASSNANTNVEMMGHTFQYAAPIVGALGYSMEDTAVAIGLMANAGIKADKAGTALRSVLTRLSAPPKECAEAMEQLGISITDSEGKMKPFSTIIDDLRRGFNGLSEAEQTQIAKSLAGQEAMSGLLAIVNAAPEDYAKLTQAVKDSTGAAEKMAATMQNNVGGKMTLLKSQLEGIYLTIWQKVEPVITKALDSISKKLKQVDWQKFGKVAGDALQKVLDAFEWLVDHSDLVINGMKLMIGAFVATKVLNFAKGLSDVITNLNGVAKGALVYSTQLGTLTAAQTANTAATTLGTKAINLFNAAWKANPIGLIVTALGLLAGGIMAVTSAFKDNNTQAEENARRLQEYKDSVDNARDSWDQLQASQQESVNKGMSEMSYYQDLTKELGRIVDENGRVKEGYQERASFITSTLKEALGVEISMQDGVIQNYENIRDQIDKTIEKKKAEILLNSQEALYTQAIQERSEALAELSQKEQELQQLKEDNHKANEMLNERGRQLTDEEKKWAKEVVANYQQNFEELTQAKNKQQETIAQYYAAIGLYEENAVKFHAQNYSEMQEMDWQYVANYAQSEEQKQKIIADGIAAEQSGLQILQGMRTDANAAMIDQQIAAANERIAEGQRELNQFNKVVEEGLSDTQVLWADNLDDILSEITGSKIEFQEAGDGTITWFNDGMKMESGLPKGTITGMVTEMIKEIAKKEPDADSAGRNLIYGVNKGVLNNDARQTVFGSIWNFGKKLLNKLQLSMEEHSPSKATDKMGRFLLQGLGLGIKAEEDDIYEQVEDFGENVLGALNGALEDGVSSNVLRSLQTAIPTEFDANITANTSRMAQAAQKADTSLVAQFKQALSQMKIEMNDREMAKFVDNTVTDLIYN